MGANKLLDVDKSNLRNGICIYHEEDHEGKIESLFTKKGFTTEFSEGFNMVMGKIVIASSTKKGL